MHTIYRHMGTALAITSFAMLCLTLCLHSALKGDGIIIGNPPSLVVYLDAPQDPRLQQLAAALPMKQFRSK